ncbi:hypothetical protein DFH94DRAFT_170169 [Russula ochroleuca]|uniref:Uncharacterized protein n=1 Tax=Russula ochroleuca TaxID=152965 RepID=A0A9P5N4I6_9AGAM|nr:hypothetical protein DFH94DRAFT_170169 [Russula ochroleuca]
MQQASDCDMVLTHDDDLLTIDGLGHDASLETLKPDVMMDLLRRSNIEIHKVLCDLSPTDSGPNTDTSVVKVATLSITSQKWNTPTPTRSSPLPLQNFDPGHASGSGDVSISSLPGSLPVPTIQGDTSKRETSLPADHGDSARPFPPISLLSSFSRNISRAFNQILIDKPFDTIEARVVHEKDLTLQRQLEHIQADFSSTKMELEHQRSANALLVSQKGQLSVELAQACAARQAQATEVHNLRTSYVELANSVRTLESSGEELRSHKSILTKTDGYSGQQMVQAVHDLNTEIFQLAAAVSDEFPLTRRSHGLWKDSHCEFIREAIGDGMLALLRDGDHEDDPTIVQLAVRAWEIWCCSQVFDAFCPGAPPEVDRFLHDVFREMQSSEPQATTSRWRTLTHMYARSVASAYNAPAPVNPGSLTSSSLISPISLPPYPKPGATANDIPDQHIFALPMPRSRTPSNAFASSLDDPSTRTGDHISGILAILSLAGCTDEHAVHIEPLHARFGEKLSRIAEQTEALARMLGEGVSSAWFEVVVERPSVTPPARSKGRAPDVWLGGQAFDPATMENMYAGYGSEVCGVLCTVAFGLSVVKRRKEGEAGREQPPSYLDMKSEAGTTRSKTDLLESTLLLKPKVLLESVKELL